LHVAKEENLETNAFQRKVFRIIDQAVKIIKSWDLQEDFVTYLKNQLEDDA
jgi:hypothetical protein